MLLIAHRRKSALRFVPETSGRRETVATAPGVPSPGPEKVAIARLLDSEIERMDRDTLIDVIRRADLPLCRGSLVDRVQFQSADELKRIAYLIRRCCQNQVNAFCAARRLPLPYKAVI